MERLTQTSNSGGVAFTFDLDITCQPSEARKILKLAEKLKAYEDAEEQGLLLPCKVGTQIYHFIYDFEEEKYMITKTTIIEVFENINGWYFRTLKDIPAFRLSDFGVSVFLTEAEAEAKLAEMEGAE